MTNKAWEEKRDEFLTKRFTPGVFHACKLSYNAGRLSGMEEAAEICENSFIPKGCGTTHADLIRKAIKESDRNELSGNSG